MMVHLGLQIWARVCDAQCHLVYFQKMWGLFWHRNHRAMLTLIEGSYLMQPVHRTALSNFMVSIVLAISLHSKIGQRRQGSSSTDMKIFGQKLHPHGNEGGNTHTHTHTHFPHSKIIYTCLCPILAPNRIFSARISRPHVRSTAFANQGFRGYEFLGSLSKHACICLNQLGSRSRIFRSQKVADFSIFLYGGTFPSENNAGG